MSTKPLNPYPEERRIATVLFADIQGFTPLAEQLDFEMVGELIRGIWRRLDQVIEDHGGFIDKHIGDAVMAVWGTLHAREDDAEQAVKAAIALQRALDEYAVDSPVPEVKDLKIRVGINTGPVFAGYVGLKEEYTVMGDTVNIASRLEHNAQPGMVIITESTYKLIRGAFRVRRLKPQYLRGKTHPVMAFMVEGELSQPSRVRYRGVGGLETRMVGRERELSQLESIYRAAQLDHALSFVLVVGDTGVGKSRLLMEYSTQLEVDEPDLTLVSGRGLAQTANIPFSLWKSLWFNRFGLREDDPPQEACEKFLRGVRTLWGEERGYTSVLEAAHLIGDLIGLEWADSPFLEELKDFPERRLKRAYELNCELIYRICSSGPLVLLIDDLQWVDHYSLDLLVYLCKQTELPMPIFILAGSRTEVLRVYPRLGNIAKVITLTSLPISTDLVVAAYPALKSLSDDLLLDLARRADGNPYFMEEMVKGLVQSDLDLTNPDETVLKKQIREQLPGSLKAMLQARLDSLSNEARYVALLASVVGRVFWFGAIMAAARQPTSTGILNLPEAVVERVVRNALRELVRAELAFPRVGSAFLGEKEYIFKHSLLRDVAYSLLPHKYLKLYHHAVGTWLSERTTPDYKVIVANHFEQAEAYTLAINQFEEAIAYARSRGALDEAEWLQSHIDRVNAKKNPKQAEVYRTVKLEP